MITTVVLSPAIDKIYFVDNFKAGNLYRVRNVTKSAGGKGINVARVASILGENVSSVGFKAGEPGKWLESKLKELGVRTEFIEVKGESRTNINIIDRLNGTETEVLEAGPHITEEDSDRFLENFRKILNKTEVLICSGGLPEGIPAGFYRTLIEIAKPFGIKVVLDSSNEMLAEGIKAKPYLIKPNIRELSRYAGKELKNADEIIAVCRAVNSKGVEAVAASMGKEGALLVTDRKVLYAKTPRVEVVNTIGSGDSMVAGMASALHRKYSIEDAFRLGVACAVANTQFMEIGYVTAELVERYMNEIIIGEY